MSAIYDNFNYTQVGAGTTGYQGPTYWSPDSSRTISGYDVGGEINGTLYPGHLFANNEIIPTSVTYTYSTPVDFSNVISLTFTDTFIPVGLGGTATFTISLNGTPVANYLTGLGFSGSTVVVPLDVPTYTSVTTLEITPANTSLTQAVIVVGPFFTTFRCVAHGSLILTPLGYKPIQDLQREEEIIGGKIARIIKTELHPKQEVESIFFSTSCLDENVPHKDTIICSEHYLVYKGERRIAKCFINCPGVKVLKGEAKDILPPDEGGNYYFYDIQFDHEGEYIVNGMISQSRSPYASVSPLPKELYFEEKNYKEERVGNTLSSLPQIVDEYISFS